MNVLQFGRALGSGQGLPGRNGAGGIAHGGAGGNGDCACRDNVCLGWLGGASQGTGMVRPAELADTGMAGVGMTGLCRGANESCGMCGDAGEAGTCAEFAGSRCLVATLQTAGYDS